MIKEIKYNGYTATPSDYECQDGDLAMAINLVSEDAEFKPVIAPLQVFGLDDGEEALLLHIVNDNERHIIIKNGTTLSYVVQGAENPQRIPIPIRSDHTDSFKCSATGNMLCVYDDGPVEHFLFIYGSYRGINPSKYDIPILFGVDVSPRQRAATVGSVVVDDSGSPQGEWETVYENNHFVKRGHSGYYVECDLESGNTYRINLVYGLHTPVYIKGTFYNENGEIVTTIGFGMMGSWFSFQTTDNIKNIFLSFWNRSDYTGANGSNLSGTIKIQELQQEIVPPGETHYSYYPVENVNNAVLGIANALIADIARSNRFSNPFFVRYGFRLITGDIVTVSAPILIEPNTGTCPVMAISDLQRHQADPSYNGNVTAYAYQGKLQYKLKEPQMFENLIASDEMIDTLVIAVSDPIFMYKQGATIEEFTNEAYVQTDQIQSKSYAIDGIKDLSTQGTLYLALPSYQNYTERALSCFNFHIIKEIDKSDISTDTDFTDVVLNDGSLVGLAGNLNLLNDNVDILSTYESGYVMTYNQREHLVGVRETKYGGFYLDCMSGYVGGTGSSDHYTNYKIGCQIPDSEGIQYLVRGKRTESSLNRRWFYYPNKNAISATIYENGMAYDIELEKHPFLNGSFHIGGLGEGVADSSGGIDQQEEKLTEGKPNMMFVSVSGNPLVVEQKLRVGDGILYAAAANTRPITRNQYGNVPLYAFSSDGIWGIELTAEGLYLTRQTVSRDVCSNIKSITNIDTAVLFATDRGIMMLQGSESKCISDEINSKHPFFFSSLTSDSGFMELVASCLGVQDIDESEYIAPNFQTFLQGCMMMYNYMHRQVVVFNPAYKIAYSYSLADGKWGMRLSDIEYTVNAYPDAWAVGRTSDGEGGYSYDINNYSVVSNPDVQATPCILITRPIKLDLPNALKTVQNIIQRGYFNKGNVKSVLYASRDLHNWLQVRSSVDHVLTGFSGTPYKYFRILLICDLGPEESIYGCSVKYEPKMTNRLR